MPLPPMPSAGVSPEKPTAINRRCASPPTCNSLSSTTLRTVICFHMSLLDADTGGGLASAAT